ncbi:MAG: hypothetical protein FJ137_14230 [Deltaproteobacteria bacterium]|nr:hypothetical protein [Deltaproteobacteria bacterium]
MNHATPRPARLSFLPALAATLAAAGVPSCVIVEDDDGPPPDPYGDISFDWSFDGVADCDEAGVDELDVVVLQDGLVVDERDGVPCVGGGLTLTDYLQGRYVVSLDAYSRTSELLYSGEFSIRVRGGEDNYAGAVELTSPGGPPPPPPPAVGSVAFFWSFLYPVDDPIVDCALAGADAVDVLLQGPGGDVVRATFPCTDDGAIFDSLPAGRWTLTLDVFGSWHDAPLHLYGAVVAVDVVADRALDLGDVALGRDEAGFADIEAVWDLTGTTCEAEGLTTLTLAIRRSNLEDAEDVTTVDCASASALRRTFVPGSYVVTLTGAGTTTTFVGSTTVDVVPDTVVRIPVHLVPQ